MLYISIPMEYDDNRNVVYSHLISDTSVEELHTFAKKINLSIDNFVDEITPFYIVSQNVVDVCVAGGAIGGLPLIKIVQKCMRTYNKQRDKEEKNPTSWVWRK